MPSLDLTNTGMKLTFEYHTTVWPELSQMGFHTGMRDPDDWDALLDLMETATGRFDQYMPETTFTRLVLSQWTTQDFVGWHQLTARDVEITIADNAVGEPHQLAISVGVRNTTDIQVPVGRRRNRTFLGPLVQGLVDGDTRMDVITATGIAGNWTGFDEDLRTIAPETPVGADYGGLCVVSPAADLLLTGDTVTVGRRFDVHRSRAEATFEGTTFWPNPHP